MEFESLNVQNYGLVSVTCSLYRQKIMCNGKKNKRLIAEAVVSASAVVAPGYSYSSVCNKMLKPTEKLYHVHHQMVDLAVLG